MVQFPSLAPRLLWIQRRVTRYSRAGLPHSDIPGSMSARDLPGLIAACYVLHRLPAPRHPPCALSSLTIDSVSYKRTLLMCFSVAATHSQFSKIERHTRSEERETCLISSSTRTAHPPLPASFADWWR